jgi:hypothetical protein
LVAACQSLDRLDVILDDDRAAANAGLLLTATLAAHLGPEQRANELIQRSEPVYFRPWWPAATASTTLTLSGPGRPSG